MKRLLSLVLLTAPIALVAQTASDVIIDRVEKPAPPVAPDGTLPAKKTETGDLDGGVQRIAQPRRLLFKLTLAYDVQAYYTSNVFLSPSDEVESVIVAHTLQTRADFNSLTLGETLLTPSAGLVYQHYNHALGTGDQFRQNLDFDAYSLPLSLRLRAGDNWEFTLGTTTTLVYSVEGPPAYNLTYKSITTTVGVRKLFGFGSHQLLSLGLGANLVTTDVDTPSAPFGYRADRNDKTDTSFDIGYYYLQGNWVIGTYTRLGYSDYLHYQESGFNDVDRRDLATSLGWSVSYNFTPWATARAFTGADWRKPQGDSFVDYSYQVTNLGLGLSVGASF